MSELEKLKKLVEVVYVCPKCRKKLIIESLDLAKCSGCDMRYIIREGIPIFAPLLFDQFYEQRIWNVEKDLSTKAAFIEKARWWFYMNFNLVMRRRRFIQKMLRKKQGLTLDLGCGAGKTFFRRVGPVIGIDICLSGLIKAKEVYNSVAQADATELPFADELFDFIVSTDLIEHIPGPQKDRLFKEMWRVLKPGGLLIHEAETLSDNLLFRLAQRDIDLFFRYFVVEVSGHFGLESSKDLIKRFEALGAEKVRTEIIFDMFWPLHEYNRLFGEGYRNKYAGLRWLTGFLDLLNSHKTTKVLTETLMGVIAGPFEKTRDIDKGKDIGLCFKKPEK